MIINEIDKYMNYASTRTNCPLRIELLQSSDEGRSVEHMEHLVQSIEQMPNGKGKISATNEFFEQIEAAPKRADYSYEEPNELEDIRRQRPSSSESYSIMNEPDKGELYDRIYGAWLGRSAGCLLGQPFEGWKRPVMRSFLEEIKNYPLQQYVSNELPEAVIKKHRIDPNANWVNRIERMVDDDDMRYPVIGLMVMEKYGRSFAPIDVANTWAEKLAVQQVATAEMVAYRNFCDLIYPPHSAGYRNPYRELIGAQIRADLFGYVNPGRPADAAEMAWRDGSISHTKNGIYGEMFVAAMLAAAAVESNVEMIIQIGLSQIPEKCRLSNSVQQVVAWKREGVSWGEAIDRIHEQYDENHLYGWVHTIPNAMIVCAALLYGAGDFTKSIGYAVSAAMDTDCNGATVGSIVGMMIGVDALPKHWVEPLNDEISLSIGGMGITKISSLARRTVACTEVG